MQHNNQETGRTMMEMIGVIAIIGVLTIGAISTVNFGLESFRVSSAFSMVENTAAAVSDLYSWKREFPTTAQAQQMRNTICDNKVFDDPCVDDQKDVAAVPTAWGFLTVAPDSASQFTITLTNVPFMSCNQLLTMNWTNVTLETEDCNEDGEAKTDIIFHAN